MHTSNVPCITYIHCLYDALVISMLGVKELCPIVANTYHVINSIFTSDCWYRHLVTLLCLYVT